MTELKLYQSFNIWNDNKRKSIFFIKIDPKNSNKNKIDSQFILFENAYSIVTPIGMFDFESSNLNTSLHEFFIRKVHWIIAQH